MSFLLRNALQSQADVLCIVLQLLASVLVVLLGGNGDARSAENSNGKPSYRRLNELHGSLLTFSYPKAYSI